MRLVGEIRARRLPLAALVLLVVSTGCASLYRQGVKAGKKGEWDLAVAKFTKATEKDPDDIPLRIALENARVEASRVHYKEAQKHLAADELEKAAAELEIAARYDPANLSAVEDLRLTREKVQRRQEEKRRLSEFDSLRTRAQATRVPAPVLSPRSPVPITIKYDDTSLEKVFGSLAKLTGVNIVFDEGYRDKRVNFNVVGVTFEEALGQLTFVNRLFYKVIDQNTLIIVPESAQKRRQYDDNYVQTFYLQNADANETVALLTKIVGIQKVGANQALGAITVVGTPDQLAFASKVIESNDKAKGEVVIEVAAMEVNRTTLKRFGIELSQYEGSVTFSPTGATGEVAGGFTTLRAQFLSSLNLADFIVSLPSTATARLLKTESSVKILAAPKLRAAEGKKTTLKIGTEVPIPVTTFTATSAGTSTFAPATSFNYRNVGVTLELTPRVTAGGEIALEMLAEFSSIGDDRNVGTGQNPIIVPTFLSRNVTGVLRLRDGETTLLGGLLNTREADSLRGALGISSIPVIGKLLSSRQKQNDEIEILMSITPNIVRAPKVTEDDLRQLNVGSLDITRVPNARPTLFGPIEEPSPTPSPQAAPQASPPPPAPAGGPPPATPAAGGVPAPQPGAPPTPLAAAPGLSPAPGPTPAAAGAVAPTGIPTPAPTASTPAGGPQAAGAPPQAVPDPSRPSPPSPGPPAPPAASETVTGTMRPGALTLRTGEIGSIDVLVLGARDVVAVELALGYDPSSLEAVESLPGPLLTLGDAAIGAERNHEHGRVRLRFTRPSPTTGAGAVASIRFKALRPGEASVQVQSLLLVASNGTTRSVVVAPSRVTITPP